MSQDRRLSIKWPTDLHGEAQAAADAEQRSLSSVIRQAVREWLDSRKQGWERENAD